MKSEKLFGVLLIMLITSGIVYSVWKFISPLRSVYLDPKNKIIFVEYRKEMVEIAVNNIETVEEQRRLGKILNVKLNVNTRFGSEFIFIPKDKDVYRQILAIKK